MKKFLAVLFAVGFLAVLVAPLTITAQTTSTTTTDRVADCCKIRRAFSFEGETWTANECAVSPGATCSITGCSPSTAAESWGMVCILNTIYRVADLIFAILLAFAILLILLAAWTFITAGGAPDKVNKARDYIFYALIGLVVAFLARAIPSIVKLLI